jgi:glycerophosphoryl diester phosphodiesterase
MEAFLHDISWVPPLRTDTLTLIFNALTGLVYMPFILFFLPMGNWLCGKQAFTRLTMVVGLAILTNSFLKDLFQDPRPPIEFALDPRVGDSYGLPSGHAQIATVMWLWLAIEFRRAWAWAAAILIAAGVGASRIYLGVHDMEDVLAGTALGVATVVIFHGFLHGDFKRLQNLNPAFYLVAIALLAPLFMYIWPKSPAPDLIGAIVAMMFLWLLGHNFEQRFIRQQRPRNWIVAIISSLVAIAGMFAVIKIGGDALKTSSLPAWAIQTAPLYLMPVYATVIAPAVFRLFGLTRAGA